MLLLENKYPFRSLKGHIERHTHICCIYSVYTCVYRASIWAEGDNYCYGQCFRSSLDIDLVGDHHHSWIQNIRRPSVLLSLLLLGHNLHIKSTIANYE